MKQILGIDLPVFIAISLGAVVSMTGGSITFWVELIRQRQWIELSIAMILSVFNLFIGGVTAIFLTPMCMFVVGKFWTIPEFLMPFLGFLMGVFGLNFAKWLFKFGAKIEIDPIKAVTDLRKGIASTDTDEDDEEDQ